MLETHHGVGKREWGVVHEGKLSKHTNNSPIKTER